MGFLTKRLMELLNKPPLYVACQFGAVHHRPWLKKRNKSGPILRPEKAMPGDGIFVDQIVSDQPSLIPQISGVLTRQRLWGCTTFVDHVSDYFYGHLMRYLSLYEVLLAKEALEKLMAKVGQGVSNYHSDNGRFTENGFNNPITQNYQKITFCGVGAHHQTVTVKNKNNILTTGANTLLLHGMTMWLQIKGEMFWPFDIKAIYERLNNLQIDHKGKTPESIFREVNVENIPFYSFYTLLSPIYVRDPRLQNSGEAGPPKFEACSRIRVYL